MPDDDPVEFEEVEARRPSRVEEPEEDPDPPEYQEIPADFDFWKVVGYKPSPQAHAFHDAPFRFRFLIWGIKGGKTFAGGHDFVDNVIKRARNPRVAGRRLLAWVVAPTYVQLETCEIELDAIFEKCAEAGYPILKVKKLRDHKYILIDGTTIHLRTAETPDYLRGPNVDLVWVDEGAFIKPASWNQVKQRISARKGEVIVTTTPRGRNWLWGECAKAGMPTAAPYGVFHDDTGRRWVSHYKTDDFPWVDKEDIKDAKDTMVREEFEEDYEAKFVASGRSVFRYIDDSFHMMPFKQDSDAKYAVGVDLAKQADWSAVIVMDGSGHLFHVERWTGVDWKIQKERLKNIADTWKAALVVDHANVGQTICDDLKEMGVQVHPVEMNSPQVKVDIIQALQAAFDAKQIKIPDPRAPWAPPDTKHLVEELRAYEAGLTSGGKLTYSAPKNMHDDLVVALALAWWGKRRGLAGGGITPANVALALDEFIKQGQDSKIVTRMPWAARRRPKTFSKVFGRMSRCGLPAGGSVWH